VGQVGEALLELEPLNRKCADALALWSDRSANATPFRVRRALLDGRIEGAVVALAMMLDRDFVIIVLQGFKRSVNAAQLLARSMTGAAVAHDVAAPQRA
jgi:hypothetical protein